MPALPNLATRHALDVCAAWASTLPGSVLIAASDCCLGKPLLQRLEWTPGVQCFLLAGRYGEPPEALFMDRGSPFTLAWVQPLRSHLGFAGDLIRHPACRQLIVLQAGFLGRRLLPEWGTHPKHNLVPLGTIPPILAANGSWFSRRVTIGNHRSLWWGFVAGRLLAWKRPDLADQASARMRHHLAPSPTGKRVGYISLLRAIRDNRYLGGPGICLGDQDRS